MEIQGHFLGGMIVPHDSLSLPDGTEVTIIVHNDNQRAATATLDDERKRYLDALSRIDAVTNENPGDTFSGADHDRILYENGS
jgi:hypothetical protein